MHITQEFDSYRELKKHLKKICEENTDANGVSVSRSRRAEWGEWFERWELNSSGHPVIIDEGWM
jgi:predicted kinase